MTDFTRPDRSHRTSFLSARSRFWGPLLVIAFVGLAATNPARGHCQVPCGIYDDLTRIAQMKEDTATIAKAITMLGELAGKTDPQSVNQATRWVITKEQHASHVITVVSEYFLTQKVKPVAPDTDGYTAYLKKLADHHLVMVAAMKAKQNANQDVVTALNKAIETLGHHYQPHEHD